MTPLPDSLVMLACPALLESVKSVPLFCLFRIVALPPSLLPAKTMMLLLVFVIVALPALAESSNWIRLVFWLVIVALAAVLDAWKTRTPPSLMIVAFAAEAVSVPPDRPKSVSPPELFLMTIVPALVALRNLVSPTSLVIDLM